MSSHEFAEETITMVEQQKNRHRYNIYLNGTFAFGVHEDIVVKFHLLKGERIDKQRMETILQAEEQQMAYLEAIRMLGRKPRSRHEIQVKLKQKGFEPAIIDHTMKRLDEHNYVDDRQFAQMWANHRIYAQKKGKKWVEQELREKGVSKEYIQEVLHELDVDAEYESALEIARKKWSQHTNDPIHKRKQRVMAFLIRRGFTNTTVNRVLKMLSDTPNDDIFEDV